MKNKIKKQTMPRRKTTPQFIQEAESVHGDLYDYSKVSYKNAKTEVEIICPKHGIFHQTPSVHLRGGICPDCKDESDSESEDSESESDDENEELKNKIKDLEEQLKQSREESQKPESEKVIAEDPENEELRKKIKDLEDQLKYSQKQDPIIEEPESDIEEEYKVAPVNNIPKFVVMPYQHKDKGLEAKDIIIIILAITLGSYMRNTFEYIWEKL